MQLDYDELKLESRNKQAELSNMKNELEMQAQMNFSLHNINVALESRLGSQEATLTSM